MSNIHSTPRHTFANLVSEKSICDVANVVMRGMDMFINLLTNYFNRYDLEPLTHDASERDRQTCLVSKIYNRSLNQLLKHTLSVDEKYMLICTILLEGAQNPHLIPGFGLYKAPIT